MGGLLWCRLKRPVWAWVLGSLWMGLALPALSANPTLTIKYDYYPISGVTAREMRAQLNRLGPTGSDRKHFDAYTRWNVNWRYRYKIRGGLCQIDTTAVTVDVVFTLPRWQPSGEVSPSLVTRWQQYMAALQLHEDGHKEHGIKAANEVVSLLEGFPGYSACSTLESEANATAQRIIQKYSQQDEDYDRSTHHGATQGAVFP